MGIFSQDKTSTNQTAYNEQVGISNRDLSGVQLTRLGQNNKIEIQSLDATALNAAAFTINHALDVVATQSQNTLSGFQQALTAGGERAPTQDIPVLNNGPGPAIGTIEKVLIAGGILLAVIYFGGK